jgi:hypothetical protein
MSKATVVVAYKPAVFNLMDFIVLPNELDMVLSIDHVIVTDKSGNYLPFTIKASSPFTWTGLLEDQSDFEFDLDPITGQFRINTSDSELEAEICIEMTLGLAQETE